MKLNKELLDKVEELTKTKFRIGDTEFVAIGDIEIMLDALTYEIEVRDRKLYDIKKYVEDNYKPIDIYDTLGLSREDF